MAKHQQQTETAPPPAEAQPNGNATQTVTRKRRAPLAPPDETKEGRFRRLAPRRVSKAIKAIAQVANLANSATYASTEAQREAVQAAIISATNSMVERFQAKAAAAETFVLPE